LCLSRFEPEGKMGIVPDEVLFCVFYCSANDILQLSPARYDAKCFAHYIQLLFVLAPYCIYSLIEHYF
jgi:hypothetical protein